MTPGRYDITIYQRSTFSIDVILPFNLTGHQVLAQVWDDKRRRKYADFTVQVLSATNQASQVRLTIPASATKGLTKQGEWDMMVVYSNGKKEYWLEGDVQIDPGYTDVPE